MNYELLTMNCLYGAFEENIASARISSLGGSAVAIRDENGSVFYNPSALSTLSKTAVSFGYSRLHLGLSDDSNISNAYFNFARPYGDFCFAVGYKNLSLEDFYSEETAVLGVSYRPLELFAIGFGLKNNSLKIGMNEYLSADPVFLNAYNRVFLEGTFGLNFHYRGFSAGYFGAFLSEDFKKYKNPEGHTYGVSYSEDDFLVSLQYHDQGESPSQKKTAALGIEKTFFGDVLLARVGLNFGESGYRKISTGLGLKIKNVAFDYAVVYPLSGISETYGNHILSVSAFFGVPEKPVKRKAAPMREITLSEVIVSTTPIGPEMYEPVRISTETIVTEILKVEVSTPLAREAKEIIRPVEERVSPPPARTHKVAPGETLQSISEKYYNTKSKWHQIYKANPEKVEKGVLRPGDVLIIP